MTKYYWEGINEHGEKISGTHNTTKQQLKNALSQEKIIILKITPALHTRNTLNTTQQLHFTEQLYWFLEAGITLSDALKMLSTNSSSHFQPIYANMRTALLKGDSFSSILSQQAHGFSAHYCAIIAAGEKCGDLLTALKQIIQHEKMLLSFYQKIKKALIYPTCVFVFSILMTMGLLLFVVPQFQQLYENMHATLPALTLGLLHLSHALHHPALWLLMIFFIIAGIILIKNTRWQDLLFKMPFISNWLHLLILIQWSTLMATLLQSTVSLIDALTCAQRVIFYKRLSLQFNTVIDDIKNGLTLSSALKHHNVFPPNVHRYLEIGETTETLSRMCNKISHQYQTQCDDMTEHLSKWIEPVMMIWVSAMIAVLLIAMYLPIFNMGNIL